VLERRMKPADRGRPPAVDRGSVELLQRACDLVRAGWSQDADARSAEGVEVQPWHQTAAAWSLLGALVAALEEQANNGRDLPLDDLAAALNELAAVIDDDSLTNWNDEPTRTHDDVINTLEIAATAAAAKLGNGR
jgi:hypothetical protein